MEEKNGLRLYTVAELAKLLRVSRQTAYTLISKGAIAAIRPEGTRALRISEDALQDYLKKSAVRHA